MSARREKYEFFRSLLGHFRGFLSERLEGTPAGAETPQLAWVLSHLRCITRKYRCDVRRVVLGHPEEEEEEDGGWATKKGAEGDGDEMAVDAEQRAAGAAHKGIVIDFDVNAVDPRIRDAIHEGVGAALFARD